ncbi:uncharacterized protein [Antedon mediterranea]|uniref:uncharacterized protein n=1 Tax=Antedon mediterranea TaxID=105859 RepID=UPI003AF97852
MSGNNFKSIKLQLFTVMLVWSQTTYSTTTVSSLYPVGDLFKVKIPRNYGVAPGSRVNESEADGACPFRMERDYDPNRIPATIWRAKNLTRFCLDVITSVPTNELCHPFEIKMQMLKNSTIQDHRGHFYYRLEEERIPVAFLCKRATV